MRLRLFAALRAKITSSARSLALLSQGSRLLILAEPHDELRGASFDHLGGAGEQRRRDFEAQSLGGGQVDEEIEFGRLLDGHAGRLGSTQNLVDDLSSAPAYGAEVWSVGHHASYFDAAAATVHGQE